MANSCEGWASFQIKEKNCTSTRLVERSGPGANEQINCADLLAQHDITLNIFSEPCATADRENIIYNWQKIKREISLFPAVCGPILILVTVGNPLWSLRQNDRLAAHDRAPEQYPCKIPPSGGAFIAQSLLTFKEAGVCGVPSWALFVVL